MQENHSNKLQIDNNSNSRLKGMLKKQKKNSRIRNRNVMSTKLNKKRSNNKSKNKLSNKNKINRVNSKIKNKLNNKNRMNRLNSKSKNRLNNKNRMNRLNRNRMMNYRWKWWKRLLKKLLVQIKDKK